MGNVVVSRWLWLRGPEGVFGVGYSDEWASAGYQQWALSGLCTCLGRWVYFLLHHSFINVGGEVVDAHPFPGCEGTRGAADVHTH